MLTRSISTSRTKLTLDRELLSHNDRSVILTATSRPSCCLAAADTPSILGVASASRSTTLSSLPSRSCANTLFSRRIGTGPIVFGHVPSRRRPRFWLRLRSKLVLRDNSSTPTWPSTSWASHTLLNAPWPNGRSSCNERVVLRSTVPFWGTTGSG